MLQLDPLALLGSTAPVAEGQSMPTRTPGPELDVLDHARNKALKRERKISIS